MKDAGIGLADGTQMFTKELEELYRVVFIKRVNR